MARLLESVRSSCGARLAAAGWGRAGDLVLTAAPGAAGSGGDEAEVLMRLAWADPELDHARVLVRTATLPGGSTADRAGAADRAPAAPAAAPGVAVAVVPLGPGADEPATPGGLLCVAGPAGGSFTPEQLERLVAVGHRLVAHRRARQVMAASAGTAGGAGAAGSGGPAGAGRVAMERAGPDAAS